MKIITIEIVSIVLLTFTLVPTVYAQTDFVVEQKVFLPTDDTHGRQDFPTTNFGTSIVMRVASSVFLGNDRSFIQFNTPFHDVRAIANASLFFRIPSCVNIPDPLRYYHIQEVSASWSETVLTWDNQPSVRVSPLANVTINMSAVEAYYYVNVTSHVRDWFSGNFTNFGIRIVDSEESDSQPQNCQIWTKETNDLAFTPTLFVNVTGLGNVFVSGLIAIFYIAILITVVLGGFWIAHTVKKYRS